MAFVETISTLSSSCIVFEACSKVELVIFAGDGTSGNRTMSVFCLCVVSKTIFKIVLTLTEPLCVCRLKHLHTNNETNFDLI